MKTLQLSIIIIISVVVIVVSSDLVYAQILPAGIPIRLSIPKFNFVDGEIIPISGYALPNSIINISLSDNLGDLENSTQVSDNNTGYFYTNLGIPSHVIGGGSWHIFASSDNNSESLRIQVNTHGVVGIPDNFPSGLPPLKQFKLGIQPNAIQCHSDFQLMVKKENGQPACVNVESANKLFDRDWGIFPLHGLPTSLSFNENFTNSTLSRTTQLPASFMSCNTPFPQSNTGIPVLYMPTNSIGKICVRYSNVNDIPEPIFGIRIFDPNNSYQNATGITTWNDLGDNYTIPKGDSTVVYWINTGNQTGFYGLDLSCGGTPFAVGYDNNSKIVSNDFPFLGIRHSCPIMMYDSHIDGLDGIGVKYIPYP